MNEPKYVDLKAGVIPVYYDPSGEIEICWLPTGFNRKDKKDPFTLEGYSDWFYLTTADDQTSTMFHITARLFNLSYDDEVCPIIGWINKKYCCVGRQVDEYVDDGVIKYLYDKPSYDSKITTIRTSSQYNIEEEQQIEEIDFIPESRWLKVRFTCDGIEYTGWTERYGLD